MHRCRGALAAGCLAVLILALDTATSTTAVALLDETSVRATFAHESPQRHAEVLGPALAELLAGCRDDVTHIVCGVGPGPFTGLRVGVASARALSHALDVPVIGVCTLDVLARSHVALQRARGSADAAFEIVVPARRREVYAAAYDGTGVRLGDPVIRPGETGVAVSLDPAALAEFTRDAVLTSTGLPPFPLYLREPDAVPGVSVPAATPRASVHVRPMRWWDIPVAAEAEAALFGETAWSSATLWSELAGVPERRHYVVAESNRRVVGYAGVAFAGTDADVQTVAVLPEARGLGIGSLLVAELEAAALDRACSRMLLEVRSDNVAAQRLYERAGFGVDGTRRGYYAPGVDAVLMSKRLEDPAGRRS